MNLFKRLRFLLKKKRGHADCSSFSWWAAFFAAHGESEVAGGIWTAVSGAQAQSQMIDTVANNLANMNTDAFKKDAPTFKEYLSVLERDPVPQEIPRGPIKDKDFYPLDGKDQAYVVVTGTHTDFRQGNLKVTQHPLDIALEGPGMFEVSTPNGIRYTRHGSFKLATDGRLVTSEGFPVLSSVPGGLASAQPASAVQPSQGRQTTQGGVAAGPDVAGRYIDLSDAGSQISISADGEIYAGNQLVAQLAVTEFKKPGLLMKQGGQLFENKDPANVSVEPKRTQTRQGMIETSNVNPAEEMTKLIQAHRNFETNMKSLKTYSEIMQKEVSEVGKL